MMSYMVDSMLPIAIDLYDIIEEENICCLRL